MGSPESGLARVHGPVPAPTRLSRVYGSPGRVVLLVGASVFAAELVVMAVLYVAAPVHTSLAMALVDAAALICLVAPTLYLLLFRPLVLHLAARERAEAELRRERNQFEGILEAMPDGVCIVSREYELEYVNPALVRVFGPGEGKLCHEYFDGRAGSCPWCVDGTEFAGQTLTWQWHTARNGRAYEVFDTPVRSAAGGAAKLEILRDVTEHRAAEAALQESERKYRMLMEQASDPIVVFDRAGRLLDLNSEACRALGGGREELLGRDLTDFLPPEELARTPLRFEILEEGETALVERSIRRADGTVVPVEFNVKRMPDGTFQAIARDLTERRRAEDAVRTARDFYLKLLDEFPNPVWRSRADGRCDYCNKAWLAFTGKSLAEELDGGWGKGIHAEDREDVLAAYREAFRARRAFEAEYRLRHRSGEYRSVVDTGRPFTHPDGRFGGFIGTCYDVTDRNRAYADLVESQDRLRRLSAHLQSAREEERTAVAREIHDELGQVLTVLKYDVAALEGMVDPGSDGRGRIRSMASFLDQAMKTVQRLCAELRPGILDDLGLEAALDWLVGQFRRRAGVACDLTVLPEDLAVDGERATAVFRIVQEALTNVVRHAKAKRVAVTLTTQADDLVLHVRDDGVGIAPGRSAAPDSFGLLGIRERTLALGGAMEISGSPGAGTTLRVRIPLGSRP